MSYYFFVNNAYSPLLPANCSFPFSGSYNFPIHPPTLPQTQHFPAPGMEIYGNYPSISNHTPSIPQKAP